MDIRLPSGVLLRGIPEGTSKEAVMRKAIAAKLATKDDFVGAKRARADRELAQRKADLAEYGNAAEDADSSTLRGRVAGSVGRFAAGVGRGQKSVVLGAGQRVGAVDQAAVNEFDDQSVDLMATPAGFIGNMVGQGIMLGPVAKLVAPLASAVGAVVGGGTAGTVAGGAVTGATVGAAAGATTPTLEGESAAVNTGVGAAGGAAFGAGGAALPAIARSVHQSKAIQAGANKVRDETARMAVKLGFKLSPAESNPASAVNQVAEGVSGKFLTRQTAQLANATRADAIAKKSLPGFKPDRALTHDNLGGYRKHIIETHYEPLKKVGNIPAGGPGGALDNAVAQVGAKVRVLGTKFGSFRKAAKGINSIIRRDLRGKTEISADDTISLISEYRAAAKVLFKKATGENGSRVDFHVANAKLELANALEDFLEQHVQQVARTHAVLGNTAQASSWASRVAKYREGRQLVARSLTLDRAISGDGHVNSLKLARMQERQQPLGGGLEQIAQIATSFPRVMGPVARTGSVPQVSILDAFIGAGTALKTGNVAGVVAAFARPAVRSTILSNLYQQTTAVARAPRAPGAVINAAPAAAAAIGAPQGIAAFRAEQAGAEQ